MKLAEKIQRIDAFIFHQFSSNFQFIVISAWIINVVLEDPLMPAFLSLLISKNTYQEPFYYVKKRRNMRSSYTRRFFDNKKSAKFRTIILRTSGEEVRNCLLNFSSLLQLFSVAILMKKAKMSNAIIRQKKKKISKKNMRYFLNIFIILFGARKS